MCGHGSVRGELARLLGAAGLWESRFMLWEQRSNSAAPSSQAVSPDSLHWVALGSAAVRFMTPRLHGVGELDCPWFYTVTGTLTFNLVTESPMLL